MSPISTNEWNNNIDSPVTIKIFEPDWKVAFGALAVAVKEAEASGDFSACNKIIAAMYNGPMIIKTGP